MKSRAFCCNTALLRRDLTRSALIWAAYLIIWFVAMPANLLSNAHWQDAMELKELVLMMAESCHMVSFFYGTAVAWFLFAYLNKSRSANFFGALPLRRETQFLTHYLAGLLCSIVPNLVLVAATVGAGFLQGVNVIPEAAIWFAAHSMTYVFYYSFAVLCAMAVGQIIAMPVLYGILNFVVVVVEAVVRQLGTALIYGLHSTSDFALMWLSPIYYFVFENNGPNYRAIWEQDIVVELEFYGWGGLWIVFAVGIVFAIAALLLYKSRRMEAAGDVIAIRCLKPVFRWCFTIGCTLVVGMVLASMLANDMTTSYFYIISACLLVSTVLGSFLGDMILTKSMRVFHKKGFANCAIACAAVLVLLVGCRMDVFGIASYVPEFEDVQGVILNNSFRAVEDPEVIQDVLELHQSFVDQQKTTEKQTRIGTWSPGETFTYVLKDGSEVTRHYRMPVTEQTAKDPNSLVRRFEAINNTPVVILAREVPGDFLTKDIDDCHVYYVTDPESGYGESIDPSAEEAYGLWHNAILLDLQAGNMGRSYHTSRYTGIDEAYTNVSVEIVLSDEYASDGRATARNYYHYSIPITAVNTIRALQELGVPENAFYTDSEWVKY